MTEVFCFPEVKGLLDFYKWRETVLRQIRFHPDRKEIRRELDDHYQDHVRDLQRVGYDCALAEQRALAAMGDAEEIGRALDRVHKPWLGWLWLASKWGVAVCGVLLVFFCLRGDFAPLRDHLTPVQRSGDYEPDGPIHFGEDRPERQDSLRIMTGSGSGTVERAGYTLSVPYAAVWRYDRQEDGGAVSPEYWYTIVVAAEDRRFWDAGPAKMPYGLYVTEDTGYRYDGDYRDDAENAAETADGYLGFLRGDHDPFQAVYYFYVRGAEPPGEWLEVSYSRGDPWSIRVRWEEVTA